MLVFSERERLTGMNFATAVPTKGSSGQKDARMEEAGYTNERMIVKSYHESYHTVFS